MQSLEQRISHLERENRRLKAIGLLVCVVMASVFVMDDALAFIETVKE